MDTCWSCQAELPTGGRFCPACGAPRRDSAPSGVERKLVTVLFADLVDSTARADSRDPEDVRDMLVPFYERMRSELEHFGGRVEKFIGDAVMALFGAPVAHEDDPERGVRAALAIKDAITGLNEARGFGLSVRVGVATGEAVVDLGARPEQGEGMAAGDVVNTGFRLAEAAPVDGIFVDESTYGATRHAIEYRSAEPVQAKGKAKPLLVWQAVGAAARLGDVSRPPVPLVNRREELDLLVGAFERAPHLVTVVGVPGIGKSRLISELASTLDAAGSSVCWRRGRSLSYGEETPFWALAEIVKSHAGIARMHNPAATEEKLRHAVRHALADPAEAEWVESHLRPLVGLLGEDRIRSDGRHEAFAAWRRFFDALAKQQPLVLVFEDIHWADEGLLEFVDHLAASTSSVPLLVICTARPAIFERHPGWGGGQPNSTLISLGPLSDDETAELVAATLLDRIPLPEDVEAAVVGRAEGNPLYAEEYARMLVDRGFLGPQGWQRTRPGELPLPESVHGIIAARLDALAAEEKGLLQDASVFGRLFSLGAVASMSGLPRYVIDERLAMLEQKQLVRRERVPAAAGQIMYAFHHALVRDVAYAQIPRARRAEKHRRAATWIETLKSERQDLAEMLTHHYQSALAFAQAAGQDTSELVERTRVALWDAGERALALNSFDPAARFLEAALELWPAEDDAPPRLLFAYAKSLFHRGRTGAAELSAARDGLLAIEEREQAAEAEIMLAYLALWHRGDHDTAFAHLEEAQALVRDVRASRTKAYVLSSVAHFLGLADEQERAVAAAEQALALADELGLDDVRARSLRIIGWLRAVRGHAAGFADLEKSIEISRASNSPEFVIAYVNLAGSHIVVGDLRRAFEVLVEARRAAARFGQVQGSAYLMEVSRVAEDYWCGRWDDAVGRAERLIGERAALAYLESWVRMVRGQVRLARGDAAGALEDSAQGLETARAAKDTQVLYPALAFRGRALAAAGHAPEAGEAIGELLSRLTGEEWSMAYFWIDLAFALHDLGRVEDLRAAVDRVKNPTRWVGVADAIARGELERAANTCGEIGTLPDEAYLRLLAAKALAIAGRHEDAEDQLARALSFHRSVGADACVREAEQVAAALAINPV
jgi:predicted ATPase/class 3 adenylate cyclase